VTAAQMKSVRSDLPAPSAANANANALVTFSELAQLEADLVALAARFEAAARTCPKDERLRCTATALSDLGAYRTRKLERAGVTYAVGVGPYECQYVEKANADARASKRRRAAAKIAEPLLAGLKPGEHRFNAGQFRALAEYLFDGEPGRIARAVKRDHFKILALKFVCDRKLTSENTMTVMEYAKARGIPHPTVSRHVNASPLKFFRLLGKRRYHINDLDALPFTRLGK
jgi:hypothetical protein